MADHFRLSTTVSSSANILAAMLSFLVAGPVWVEDASYTLGGSGDLFIKTAGGTSMYVQFEDQGGSEVIAHYVPDGSNGYGGAAGALLHFSDTSVSLLMDTTNYDYSLDQFASLDRAVFVLVGTIKAGVTPAADQPAKTYQIMYVGGYTAHDTSTDTYPSMVAGNSAGGFFPVGMAKRIGASNRQWNSQNGELTSIFSDSLDLPRNARAGNAYLYNQVHQIRSPGSEDSFAPTGVFITHPDSGVEVDITVGSDTYRLYSGDKNADPNLGCYAIIKGTVA